LFKRKDRLKTPLAPPSNTPVYRTELNPLHFLERSARIFPNKTAIYVPELPGHPGRIYSYAEFGRRVRSLASKLIKEGLKKGETVAYLVPNTVG
jgi:fatty-acyl-CoA synthase